MEKINILCVFASNPIGGVGTYFKNLVKYVDKDDFTISFLFFCDSIDENFKVVLDDYTINYIKLLPFTIKNIKKNYVMTNNFMANSEFDIVHIHSPNISTFINYIAKKNDICTRIIHAHSIKSSNSFIKRIRNRILMIPMKKNSTNYFGCNDEAIKYYFGNCRKGFVATNGIILNDFIFNVENREKMRKKHDIKENTLVLGHVGRFSSEKNHSYFLKLASKLKLKNISFVFVLIGDGPLFSDMKQGIIEKELSSYFILLGHKENINIYYSMFDLFILPSKFEGSPISIIEAKANSLRVLVSDKVPKFIDTVQGIYMKNLDNIDDWVQFISLCEPRNSDVKTFTDIENYDLRFTISSLEKEYKKDFYENKK